DGIDNNGRAVYQSSASSYSLQQNANTLDVVLTHTDAAGVVVNKRFSFERGSYLINVSYEVQNNSANPWQANLFGQINRNNFPDPSNVGGVGARNFLGFAATSNDDPYMKISFEDVDEGIAAY